MAKLRVHCFSVSLDGCCAGPNQDIDNPLGIGGLPVFNWQFATRAHRRMHGGEGGSAGLDNDLVEAGFKDIGAWIIGRNMFGPVRGPWPDENWRGWWGDNPVYHTPVFVLTNHPRGSLVMVGGTTFHFVTDGIHAALERARQAAGDKDVRLGGGAAAMRQFLQAGLIDEMHYVISPVLIGSGERPFEGLNLPALGYQLVRTAQSENATHVFLTHLPRT